ncbi:hypothetical protein KFK09_004651 [Dendrobium nobile]|uniref:Uncharacterized protein n=1 Tax=Dendrobium nobile TaxID=94219 RepID=A0A8T3C6U4_DENNO|nr:hypothetical protein KFK09_004651 [Dendrobium nobile]
MTWTTTIHEHLLGQRVFNMGERFPVVGPLMVAPGVAGAATNCCWNLWTAAVTAGTAVCFVENLGKPLGRLGKVLGSSWEAFLDPFLADFGFPGLVTAARICPLSWVVGCKRAASDLGEEGLTVS